MGDAKVDGTLVETTWSHPFYVPGEGWVEVKDLRAGDLNVSASGETIEIAIITVSARYETVYNFTVEDDHSYFVSERDVLVHNVAYAGCIAFPVFCAAAGAVVAVGVAAGVVLSSGESESDPDESTTSRPDNDEEYERHKVPGAKPVPGQAELPAHKEMQDANDEGRPPDPDKLGVAESPIDRLLQNAVPGRQTKGRTKQWIVQGDLTDAINSFMSFKPGNIQFKENGVIVGQLPDGSTILVNPESSSGTPTLEFQQGQKRKKFRFQKH